MPNALRDFRLKVARWIAPNAPRRNVGRIYNSAQVSRLTTGWASSNSSADGELLSSLTMLRTRSRALVRDAAYAKRARVVIQNNVIGTGIGVQPRVRTTRDDPHETINDAIEREWDLWTRAKNCHTGGELHFADIERMSMGQVFEAGEIFVRKHYTTFGQSRVPFALEVIEAERMADEYAQPSSADPYAVIRLGIEVDYFCRPIAYWMRERHPGDVRFPLNGIPERYIRVPANEMIHLKVIDRWPQTRGEPWMHAVARKLNDMDGYSEAEIIAARGAAAYMGIIETDDLDNPIAEPQKDGSQQVELSPGLINRLGPGEKWKDYAPNRPNSAMDPFMRMMLREVAAGISLSYETLSRDYSQSNYSSSRLSLLDDRDVWRTLQQWFIRSFREEVHRDWMQQAVLSRAIPEIPLDAYVADPERYAVATFKPRGWSWIDPTKEVEAYKEAVRCGFTTVSAVIEQTGNGSDLEDVLEERRQELDDMGELDLRFESDPVAFPPRIATAQNQPQPDPGKGPGDLPKPAATPTAGEGAAGADPSAGRASGIGIYRLKTMEKS